MAATAVCATGSSITFSGFTYPVIRFNGPGLSAKVIDANKMSTTSWEDKIPGSLVDPGEISATVEYNGILPTIGAAAQTITVTCNGNARTGKAFITKFEPTAELEDKLTAEVVFTCTGAWS